MARSTEREQFLADVIIGAVEGGTGYWAAVVTYEWADRPPADVNAVIYEDDGVADTKIMALAAGLGRKPSAQEAIDAGFAYRIGCDTIAKGVRLIRELRTPGLNHDLRATILAADRANDAGEIDADGADAIVQFALFGELVYG